MKKFTKISLVLMVSLLFSSIIFGQTAKESTKENSQVIVSVNNVQTITENIIVFGAKGNNNGTIIEATIIGDCLTKKASILVMVDKGIAYRLFLKMATPGKDSPTEIALIAACNQKEKEQIN